MSNVSQVRQRRRAITSSLRTWLYRSTTRRYFEPRSRAAVQNRSLERETRGLGEPLYRYGTYYAIIRTFQRTCGKWTHTLMKAQEGAGDYERTNEAPYRAGTRGIACSARYHAHGDTCPVA